MTESIIIGIVFLAAVGYLFTLVRKQFSSKSSGCAKGCGGACSTSPIDLKKIEMQLQNKKQTV